MYACQGKHIAPHWINLFFIWTRCGSFGRVRINECRITEASHLISPLSWQLCSETLRHSWTTVYNPFSRQRTWKLYLNTTETLVILKRKVLQAHSLCTVIALCNTVSQQKKKRYNCSLEDQSVTSLFVICETFTHFRNTQSSLDKCSGFSIFVSFFILSFSCQLIHVWATLGSN